MAIKRYAKTQKGNPAYDVGERLAMRDTLLVLLGNERSVSIVFVSNKMLEVGIHMPTVPYCHAVH